MRPRLAGAVILGCVALSTALLSLAVLAYPGGTWNDRATLHFDWLHNLLCDLLSPVALDGADNTVSARATMLAMWSLDVGLGFSFWFLPEISFPERPTLARWLRGFGLLATTGLLLLPLAPPSMHSRLSLHALVVFAGGLPALVAAALALIGLSGDRRNRLFLVAACLVAIVVSDLVVYGHYLATGGPVPLSLPLLERPAIVLLIGWLAMIAIEMRRAPRAA